MLKYKQNLALSFLPVLLAIFSYLIYDSYEKVKEKSLSESHSDQVRLATQAAKGIESFFNYYLKELTFLASIDDMGRFDKKAESMISAFYQNHSDQIAAVTRVSSKAKIIYTVPMDSSVIGKDISYQDHVKKVLETRKTVVSNVFMAVQGYQTVAFHVPVYEGKEFMGSLAILIPVHRIAKEYVENIKIGETGFAWMLSGDGTELYCPLEGHVGKSIYETSKDYPSVIAMADEILKGEYGQLSYYYDNAHGGKSNLVEKIAVYYPVRLGDTFWSIIISVPKSEIYATITGFRNRMLFIFGLLIVISLLYFYYFMRAWKIVKEESKRKKAEEALRQSEKLLRKIADNYPNSIVAIVEKNMKIGFTAGKGFTEQNKDPLRFTGLSLEEVFGNAAGTIKENYMKSFDGEERSFELFIDGEYHLYHSVPLYEDNGEINKILTVVENISERKLAEEVIKRNLKEKEVLLKEIHHRVKNNLNVIVSLLDLQSSDIKNEKHAKTACIDSINRIKSMALVHDRLYQANDFSRIEFSEYIQAVIGELSNIYNPSGVIKIEYDLDEAYIPIEKAIPCGLILNELVTNALRHAFSGKRNSELKISFKRAGNEEYLISVADNGSGLPAGVDVEQTESLGLSLVRILTQQINGRLDIKVNHGTEFNIVFAL